MASKFQKQLSKRVAAGINNLFDSLSNQLLSPSAGQKFLSLEGMYDSSTRSHGFYADKENLDTLKQISRSYIEALRNRTLANVVQIVNSKSKSIGDDLRDEMSKAENALRRIVETETNKYKAFAQLDNISRRAAIKGEDDPYVFFEVNHADACDDCKNIHLDSDGKPRLYRLSELSHGYHRRGGTSPCVMGLHPNCRCELRSVGG